MFFHFKHSGWLMLLGTLAVSSATAVDLKTAYHAAILYDAELLAAKASMEEYEEGVPVARAALLPQLGYSTQRNKAETTTEYLRTRRPDSESGRYDSRSSSLTFRQALFRKPAWDALQGAKAQAEAAKDNYQFEMQHAGLRVAAAYLEVLSAREGVSLARNQLRAMEAWLGLAERYFKAGRGTRVDVEDARSRRDMAKAKETEANQFLLTASRNFEVVSGIRAEKIEETNPRALNPELMRVKEKDQWLQRIEDNSPEIQSLRNQLLAAAANVRQAWGGHLPTVDLVAARQFSESDTVNTIGSASTTDYVGIQVNVPLISGGGVIAQTRQAQAREERVRQTLESARRKTIAEGSRLYSAVEQGIEQVQALNQAIASAQEAVQGEKKAVMAGTRTFVDALDAERRLFESMREQALSVYSLANNRLKFLALAGVVDVDTVEEVSIWLASAKL